MKRLRLFGGLRDLKIVIRGNMHMDTRAIRVADFKSKFKFQI